jgi:RNA polymerase sigma factor (sigma-70 family)
MQTRGDDAAARVAAIVIEHQETLLRTARRVSVCGDDAHDAVQRALEIYLRRLDTVSPATELAWLKVVVRNEALAVRKARLGAAGGEEVDPDAIASPAREPDERASSAERVARCAEALRRLKPDQARALLAKSLGLSYDEIAERFGWSLTKVNRCLVEGRARFREVYDAIEDGSECDRLAPLLAALAHGTVRPAEVEQLRPHLRRCASCRATVRQLQRHRLQRHVAWLPVPLPVRWLGDRLAQAKAEAYGLAARASELALAAPGGGGRGVAATALVGLCVGGAGATGYCVATEELERPQGRERAAMVRTGAREPAPRTAPARVSGRAPVTPAARPRPRQRAAPASSAPPPVAQREPAPRNLPTATPRPAASAAPPPPDPDRAAPVASIASFEDQPAPAPARREFAARPPAATEFGRGGADIESGGKEF